MSTCNWSHINIIHETQNPCTKSTYSPKESCGRLSWQNKAKSACAAKVCTWQFPELCPASCCGWSGLQCARDMLMYAFKRDITSRHNKSTNKCQPVFALMAGFRREEVWGRKNSSRESETGEKKCGHKHMLHELGERMSSGTQSPTL